MRWKVEREARIDPPIHGEYFLSGGAMILIFLLHVAKATNSLFILSAIPGNIVLPPERTTFPYNSFLISGSHSEIELYMISWIPAVSIPRKDGWKRASGHLNLSFTMGKHFPSGSS